MSFQFILGDASYSHQKAVSYYAHEWLKQDQKRDVFFIVPNHMKFELEVQLLKELKKMQNLDEDQVFAKLNVQILSFSRLAWYLLQKINYKEQPKITRLGINLLLYDLIFEYRDELQTFYYELNKVGFLDSLGQLFEEFLMSGLTGELLTNYLQTQIQDVDLQRQIQSLNEKLQKQEITFGEYSKKLKKLQLTNLEVRKLSDFIILYQMFAEKMKKYNYGEFSYLDEVEQVLQDDLLDLSNIRFIFTGFHYFQAKEQTIIELLAAKAPSVMVDLVIDPAVLQQSKTELFHATYQTYYHLLPLKTEKNIILEAKEVKPNLQILNQAYLSVFEKQQVEFNGLAKQEDVCVVQTVDTYHEINYIAGQIQHLIASGKYRYQDIQILTRDLEKYQTELGPIFQKYNIAYHINELQPMTSHPLIIMLKQIFKLVNNNFQYEDVLKFLKTYMYKPNDLTFAEYIAEIDQLENTLISYVPTWQNFLKAKVLLLDDDDKRVRLVQKYQQQFQQLFQPLIQAFETVQVYQDYVLAIMSFFEQLQVTNHLSDLVEKDIAEGRLEHAKRHEQVWHTLMDLFDEFVNLLGEKPIQHQNQDLKLFMDLLFSALKSSKYSQIPATLDEIEVTNIVRQSTVKRKITFVLGADDHHLPQLQENKTLLTDLERQKLEAYLQTQTEDLYLLGDTHYKQKNELFFAYLASLSATDKIYFSYSLQTDVDQSEQNQISPYLRFLHKPQYSGLPFKRLPLIPNEHSTAINYLNNREQTIALYLLVARLAQNQECKLPVWLKQIIDALVLTPSEIKLLSSLDARNLPLDLTATEVQMLYPKPTILTSASAIEVFYACQYRYFLEKQLSIKERKIFNENESSVLGTMYHQIFDESMKRLLAKNKKLIHLATEAEWQQIIQQVTNEVLDEYDYTFKKVKSAKIYYLRYKLQQIILKTAQVIQQQTKYNANWHIAKTEQSFGYFEQDSLKPVQIDLQDDKKLKIRGKIDRIDILDDYLTVVDYKSGNKSFNWMDFYNGLLLQLPTYLLALQQNLPSASKYHLGGAGYQHINYPKLDKLEKKLSQMALDGIYSTDYLAELQKTEQVELDLAEINKIKVTKSGTYSKAETKVVSSDDLQLILQYNEKLYRNAGNQLYQGKVNLNPCSPEICQTCPFRSICQFDPLLQENNYRTIQTPTGRENKRDYFFKLIAEEENNEDSE